MSDNSNMIKLLCIEDSENDFILFKATLQKNSFFTFEAQQCNRVKKAIEYLQSSNYDIIFLDLHLPDSKGTATLDSIFSLTKNIPIIVMTDSTDPQFTFQAIDRGAQDFMIKGNVNPDTLARSILLSIRRKKFETRIKSEKEDAEKISRFKSEFLANMSHEIRTPMNGVVGIASIIRPENDEQAQQLETIRLSAGHLLSIVNNILDMSKIEAGMLEFEHEEIEIRPIFDEVLDMFAEQAYRKKVNLYNKIDKNIPKLIQGDSTYIRQICCNLINNALKFTEKGSVTLKAQTIYNDGQELLHVEVKDTGIGIAENQISNVFNTFEQAEPTIKRRYGGSGLGLAICKQLVELMGGEINVHSSLSKGSCFWFRLPLEKIDLKHSPRPDLSLKPIVVISDCTESLDYLDEILSMRDIPFKKRLYSPEKEIEAIDENAIVIIDIQNDLTMEKIFHLLPKLTIFIYSKSQSSKLRRRALKVARPYKQREIYNALACIVSPKFSPTNYRTKYKKFKLRALVAEDDAVNQLVTKKILRVLGVEVDIANTGLQAVAMVEGGDYDLVFMDCHMPEMDGYQAVREIRKLKDRRKANIPIIALTADALLGTESTCLSAGMDLYLSKPVQLEAMREKITQIMTKLPA